MRQNEATTHGQGRGNSNLNNGGRGRRRGRFQGEHERGRGRRGRGAKRGRHDSWFIHCADGSRLEVHPSYQFSNDQWNKILYSERNKLLDMMYRYNENKRQRNPQQISQANSYYNDRHSYAASFHS